MAVAVVVVVCVGHLVVWDLCLVSHGVGGFEDGEARRTKCLCSKTQSV